jgi:hypothetical protein
MDLDVFINHNHYILLLLVFVRLTLFPWYCQLVMRHKSKEGMNSLKFIPIKKYLHRQFEFLIIVR